MSAPELRGYRVSLVGCGVDIVWVTAESRTTACAVAERISQNRSALAWRDGGFEHVEVLDEYEDGGAG